MFFRQTTPNRKIRFSHEPGGVPSGTAMSFTNMDNHGNPDAVGEEEISWRYHLNRERRDLGSPVPTFNTAIGGTGASQTQLQSSTAFAPAIVGASFEVEADFTDRSMDSLFFGPYIVIEAADVEAPAPEPASETEALQAEIRDLKFEVSSLEDRIKVLEDRGTIS